MFNWSFSSKKKLIEKFNQSIKRLFNYASLTDLTHYRAKVRTHSFKVYPGHHLQTAGLKKESKLALDQMSYKHKTLPTLQGGI